MKQTIDNTHPILAGLPTLEHISSADIVWDRCHRQRRHGGQEISESYFICVHVVAAMAIRRMRVSYEMAI